MTRHAVIGAHQQNGIVKHLQRALGLSGEIYVTRCIEEHEVYAVPIQHRLRREDGDAARSLHGVRVEVRVPVVNSAAHADGARMVEQRLGERGLARIHVRHDAHNRLPHRTPLPANHAARRDS